jgi:hypothetical protein
LHGIRQIAHNRPASNLGVLFYLTNTFIYATLSDHTTNIPIEPRKARCGMGCDIDRDFTGVRDGAAAIP